MATILRDVVHSPSAAARRRARRLPLLLTAVVIVPGLAACGGDDKDKTETKPAAEATTTATTAATTEKSDAAVPDSSKGDGSGSICAEVEAPDPRSAEPDLPKPKPATLSGKWTVTMATSCGTFKIRLDTKRQPKTAASFAALTRAKFYDGLSFHRVVPGFVIQGGDPGGDGNGGPGYKVRETPPKDAAYTRGVVAMAKAGNEPAGTSGSQFFVVVADDDAGLPPDYAIVGKVTSGMRTVTEAAALGNGDGPPSRPIVIQKATLSKG